MSHYAKRTFGGEHDAKASAMLVYAAEYLLKYCGIMVKIQFQSVSARVKHAPSFEAAACAVPMRGITPCRIYPTYSKNLTLAASLLTEKAEAAAIRVAAIASFILIL